MKIKVRVRDWVEVGRGEGKEEGGTGRGEERGGEGG